jgi:transposase-like protein
MAVKEREELVEALARTQSRLREVSDELGKTNAAVLEMVADRPGIGVSEVAERFGVSEEALVALLETLRDVLGERDLSVPVARRAALIAASSQAWEDELGPLLTSTQVRELLGNISRQRVDELLRARRLIGLRDRAGRRQFPAFQFRDGRPLEALVAAFWTVADGAVSEWTAAAWCTASDVALDSRSPAQWASEDRDAERLVTVARQDAARLAQ